MKAVSGIFQFTVFGDDNIAPSNLNVTGKIIPCSNEVKLRGITIDNQLSFKKRIEDLYEKVSFQLHVL